MTDSKNGERLVFSSECGSMDWPCTIKKLAFEEVQLLSNLSQGFSRTAIQSQFAALGIFLLGMSLFI
jgi:hypothetical protein